MKEGRFKMYLISANNFKIARDIASIVNIFKTDWAFVPEKNQSARNKIIDNLKGDIPLENLCGDFKQFEIEKICGNYLKPSKEKGRKFIGIQSGDIVEILDGSKVSKFVDNISNIWSAF